MTEQSGVNGAGWSVTAAAVGHRAFATVQTGPVDDAGALWTVLLDGRPLRTVGGGAFAAPGPVAQAAAEEWAAQGAQVDPATMPITRAINTAIDRIAPARESVIDDIAAYGGSDLVCYRAAGPDDLVARETAAWDPLVEWAADALAAPLSVIVGLTHQRQPILSTAALRRVVAEEEEIGLAALYELTTLSSSLVIALAVRHGRLDVASAWSAARLDEEYQIEKWGRDAEAEVAADANRADFEAAARLALLLPSKL